MIKVPTECLHPLRLSPDRAMLGCVATDESDRRLKFVTMPVAGGASRVELQSTPAKSSDFSGRGYRMRRSDPPSLSRWIDGRDVARAVRRDCAQT